MKLAKKQMLIRNAPATIVVHAAIADEPGSDCI
jgi:hypothetical protein